jgi:multidrug transporter EmrE-like cation transporter
MPDRLIITDENQLKEVSIPERPRQPLPIQLFAKFISYVFHPLFIPLYITYFIIQIRSYQLAGINDWVNLRILLQVFVNCTFLPLASILLLRALNFIDSVFLKTQRDRIIPYIICMIFYFWNWYVFKNNHEIKDLVSVSMAIFNASVLGFLVNISMKVSMHAISVGVMTTFVALLAFSDSSSFSFYLSIAVLIAGIVCTSRLIVSDHSQKEIYYGFLIGILSQLAAHYFVNA